MSANIVRFGPFNFDHDRGTLFRDDMLVPVGQRGATLLKALFDRRGDMLTKKELVDAAWPSSVLRRKTFQPLEEARSAHQMRSSSDIASRQVC